MRALIDLLPEVEAMARGAARIILEVYASDFDIRAKADDSPVTEADERAEAFIVQALAAFTPGVPIVAEELAARGTLPAPGGLFWLVDPLDGTREFVSRNGEFTVNIALIEQGRPVLGVVQVPVADRLYAGVAGQGSWIVEAGQRRPIRARTTPREGATLACSRSHGDEAALSNWLQGRPIAARVNAGSSLKFGLIAAGQADLYPRLGPTMEWDTAAGHAVLWAAGGRVCDLAGLPLAYGKPGHANPPFVASGAA